MVTSHCGDTCPSSRLLRKPGLPERFEFSLRRADAAIAISSFTEERLARSTPSSGTADCAHSQRCGLVSLCEDSRAAGNLDPKIHPGSCSFSLAVSLTAKVQTSCCRHLRSLSTVRTGMWLLPATVRSGLRSSRSLGVRLLANVHVHLIGQVKAATKTWLLQNALTTVLPCASPRVSLLFCWKVARWPACDRHAHPGIFAT